MGYVVICIDWEFVKYVQADPKTYNTHKEAKAVADSIEEKWQPLVVPECSVDRALALNTQRLSGE